jgi:nitrate/TMAO reductase-like tetraheme cytochrome c subunit
MVMNAPIDNDSAAGPPPSLHSRPRKVHKWRRRLLRSGIILGVAFVSLVVLFYGSNAYMSRPKFCASCHIMWPYYKAWKNDVHSTPKAYARCVDCHYAPGEQTTFRAKFAGLSRVVDYFSGRYGASRPRAHVRDSSCLRSGCHADRTFMTTDEKLGNVLVTHDKHMNPKSSMLVKDQEQLAQLHKALTGRLGQQRLADVTTIAQAIETAEDRDRKLMQWLAERSLSSAQDDVLQYAALVDTQVRIAQLGNLHCPSCHQFNATLKSHITLAKTTCYTCHFMNQPYNAYTGKCLTCHHPAATPVPVHYGRSPAVLATATAPTTASVITMNHAVILEHHVHCISCHADLIHGTGQVTRRACQECHDQAEYLKDFDHLTDAVVEGYHRVHIGGEYARCVDCHRLIDHKLAPVVVLGEAEAILDPVLRDCQHCHPGHHREQVEMLMGEGGYTGGVQGMSNPMMGARANCRACHTKAGDDPTDELVIEGTKAACRGCHSKDYEELFTQWQNELRAQLAEAQALMAQVQGQLAAPTTQSAGRNLDEARRLFARAKGNIDLVAIAGGMHNRYYSLLLLDQADTDLRRAREIVAPQSFR